ncbi:hypothetical protein RA13_18120 [Bacillus atrophaeus]|nr:hypothetical protein RA13_18120 [Bacillus atrophaeus]
MKSTTKHLGIFHIFVMIDLKAKYVQNHLLKREVLLDPADVQQLYLGAIRNSSCLYQHEDGKVREDFFVWNS